MADLVNGSRLYTLTRRCHTGVEAQPTSQGKLFQRHCEGKRHRHEPHRTIHENASPESSIAGDIHINNERLTLRLFERAFAQLENVFEISSAIYYWGDKP